MAITFTKTYQLVSLAYHPELNLTQRRELRNAEAAKVKAAGFRTEYRFDNVGLANAMAARVLAKTGVAMSVAEAFGANF